MTRALCPSTSESGLRCEHRPGHADAEHARTITPGVQVAWRSGGRERLRAIATLETIPVLVNLNPKPIQHTVLGDTCSHFEPTASIVSTQTGIIQTHACGCLRITSPQPEGRA